MPLDRAAALRQAEKLVRQGKLDQAIAEYVTLVTEQPRDWSTANLLGDLLVRAGKPDEAIVQFARSGDTLRDEGFLPRAAALYKKVLKLRPQDDHALTQAGELAAQQGLLADARGFLRAVVDARRARGDQAGALRMVARLGTLDKADVGARMAGAEARVELGDPTGAIRELVELATRLLDEGREAEALAPLREVVRLEPGHAQASADLARILIGQGAVAEAAQYLESPADAASPAPVTAAAEACLRAGDHAAALALIDGLLQAGGDEAADAVTDLATSLAIEMPEVAFGVLGQVVDRHVAAEAWGTAAAVLRAFLARAPGHVGALARLVDVCVDGGDDEGVVDAQSRLVEAYLAGGAATEARLVAEDLVRRQPGDPAHVDRLRDALRAAGETDPDTAAADWLAEVSAVADPPTPPVTSTPESPEPEAAVAQPEPVERSVTGPHAIDLEAFLASLEPAPGPLEVAHKVEEDLSVALDELRPASAVVPPTMADRSAGSAASADLDEVFRHLRDEAQRRPVDEAAELSYQRGKALYEAGAKAEAVEPLRTAARSPAVRYAAASLLARVFRELDAIEDALEWLGHAAEAPVRSEAERHRVLFQLADLLETVGESARALAVCIELQSEAGEYEDIGARISRLSTAQERG